MGDKNVEILHGNLKNGLRRKHEPKVKNGSNIAKDGAPKCSDADQSKRR